MGTARQSVNADWTASYDPALSVRRGERLKIGRTDPANPGWRWCENHAGLGGWLPEALIDGDRITQNFDSRELTVASGTPVEILETRAGWHLCRTDSGDIGWLPASRVADDTATPPPRS